MVKCWGNVSGQYCQVAVAIWRSWLQWLWENLYCGKFISFRLYSVWPCMWSMDWVSYGFVVAVWNLSDERTEHYGWAYKPKSRDHQRRRRIYCDVSAAGWTILHVSNDRQTDRQTDNVTHRFDTWHANYADWPVFLATSMFAVNERNGKHHGVPRCRC